MPSAGEQFRLSFQRPSDPALMRGSGRKSADRAGNEVAVHSRIQPGNHVAGDGDRIAAVAAGALRAAGPSGAITCRDMPKLAAGRAPDGPICSTCSTLPTATCPICSEEKFCGMLAEIGDDRTRFADPRGLKAFAGSAPVTRSGKKTVVLHRHIKNRRLAAVGPIWALASLRASPGARRHYDARRAAGDWNHQAQRHLFNKFLGQLHHCLQTGQLYDEHRAFPPPLPRAA
jgi:hypothetical protein